MKKRICMILAVLFLLAAASCVSGTPAGETTDTGTDEPETVRLFGGADDYRIVVPVGATTGTTIR